MARYELRDPIYGTVMIVEKDTPPTDAEAQEALSSIRTGDRVFDDLSGDEKYIEDAKTNYQRRNRTEWKGNDKDLVEDQFEYWNGVDNNLIKGATSGYSFSKLPKEDKQRAMRLFDTYDRTNMTGQGARPFLEQLKGVGKAVTTDASNLVYGAGLWTMATKFATKGLSKMAMQKLLFPAASGATWAATSNVEKQAREIALDAKSEIDTEEVADSAKVGAVLGFAGPVVTRNVGRAGEFLGRVAETGFSKKKRAQVSLDAQTTYVNTLGGGTPAAQNAVNEELGQTIGKGNFDDGATGAFDLLTKKARQVTSKFTERYTALGELNVRTTQLNKFVLDMKEAGLDVPEADDVLKMLDAGEYTRTEALRELRGIVGSTLNDAYQGKGTMAKRWRIVKPFEQRIKKLFLDAAEGANKGPQAKLIDEEYSSWMKFQRNIDGGGKDIIKAGKDKTKLDSLIVSLMASPNKSLSKWEKVMKQVDDMGKWSQDSNFKPEMRKFVLEAVKSELFQGKNPKGLKFLESETGVKTLKKLFPEQAVMLDDLSKIYQNATKAGRNSIPLFWGKISAAILGAGFGGKVMGGQLGAAVGTAASLKGMQAALSSPAFRKMAMNAYRDGQVNEKAVNGMMIWLEKKAGLTPAHLKSIRQQLLGTAIVGGGAVIEDALNGGEKREEIMETINQYGSK